jgi:hypothetical protein
MRWPTKALGAVRKLFEPLQDIDVYVEDQGDEVFYTELIKRLVAGRIRVVRVFSKGCRESVVDAAKTHVRGDRAALFLIDGDLEWVKGLPPPADLPHLHRLDAYCIENFILCASAIVSILKEELVIDAADAAAQLNFDSWLDDIRPPLTELFAAFSVCNSIDPTHPTVSTGVARLCTKNGQGLFLDAGKVQAQIAYVMSVAENKAGKDAAANLYAGLLGKINSLPDPLHAVSGKDFLFPLMVYLLNSNGCNVNRRALRFKLALRCELEKLKGLENSLLRMAAKA